MKKQETGAQQLRRVLKVNLARAYELMREPEWPFGRGKWSDREIAKIKAHMAERRALNRATAGAFDEDGKDTTEATIQALSKNPERVAKIKLIIERTAKLRLERELLAGGYQKSEEVEKTRVARVYAVRAKMQEVPLRSSLIAHKSESECTAILTDWMREICNFFAGVTA